MKEEIQIITFYEFRDLSRSDLAVLRGELFDLMKQYSVLGTIIIAKEGFNGTVCAPVEMVDDFVKRAGGILGAKLECKSSFNREAPFKTRKVKIKREIVTFGEHVDVSLGHGTHLSPAEWNDLIKRDDIFLLDTRNDYEYKSGSFIGAVNPETEKFSDLPAFVSRNLDPEKHPSVAVFCTGGIRCEKVAPYLLAKGFKNVYQLEGGILKYLETVPTDEQLWQGECFVFDERVSVDGELKPGSSPDHSYSKGKQSGPRSGADTRP